MPQQVQRSVGGAPTPGEQEGERPRASKRKSEGGQSEQEAKARIVEEEERREKGDGRPRLGGIREATAEKKRGETGKLDDTGAK